MKTITPPFDLFFMTYDEPEAEANWECLKKIVPSAKRVHGVKGIARAWCEAGRRAETSHFFTMDGDSLLKRGFNFHIENFHGGNDQRVHVYRCQNQVNALVYGYGSIHLFPTDLVRKFTDYDVVDFTLSVATKGFCIQPQTASLSCFNTSDYISWKSGFREASKLASKTNAYVNTKPDHRSSNRLKAWCSLGRDVNFGNWCILGARMGAVHGFLNANSPEALAKISDHEWFKESFEKIKNEDVEKMLLDNFVRLEKLGFTCDEVSSSESARIKFYMSEV